MRALRIVKQGEGWVVVDKPAGFHAHPPENREIRIHPRWNAQAILQTQLGMDAFPMHRLDRATSGLLLYSQRRELNSRLQAQFASRQVRKTYFALIRGKLDTEIRIELPLRSEGGALLPAATQVLPVLAFELPLPSPNGMNRQFTLVNVEPETGRFHQIRRHLALIGNPLIGDSRHGDRKLNRAFSELTGLNGLYLRCMSLSFLDPVERKQVQVKARWTREWHQCFDYSRACPVNFNS